MARKSFNMLLSASLVAAALVSVGVSQPALAKSKHSSAGRGAYFVPPPPPYAPSILPENSGHYSGVTQQQDSDAPAEVAVKPPENPYKRYIYTRDAGDMPRVVPGAIKARVQNRNVVSYNFHSKS